MAVAVALNKAVNGTSLMLMLEIGKAFLLLPGDAQWGTWSTAMKDQEWAPLLGKTCFYKVGHHGSHNATPIDFVETMLGSDFSAMVSVRSVKKWKNIPKQKLIEALRVKTGKVVLSNDQSPPPEGFRIESDVYKEVSIPF